MGWLSLLDRIDWPGTAKRRARAGRFDEPVFVCRQPEERYDVDENPS